MGNEQVKFCIDKYCGGEALSEEERGLLRKELTQKNMSLYNIPGIDGYEQELRDLYLKCSAPLAGIYLSRPSSSIVHLQLCGMLYNVAGARSCDLTFDPISGNNIIKAMLHTARPHVLRSDYCKVLSLPGVDTEQLRHAMWTDHDTEGYSGILLVLVIYEGKYYYGSVGAIDNIPSEYRLFLGKAEFQNNDEAVVMNQCHVRSLLIAPGDTDKHHLLARLGLLFSINPSVTAQQQQDQ